MMQLLHITILMAAGTMVVSTSEEYPSSTTDYEGLDDYDCTGSVHGKECRPPTSCPEEFNEICPKYGSTCCPEMRYNHTDIIPLSTATDCRDRKCTKYYNGWWAVRCRFNSRTLYECNKTNLKCCASACRISNRCKRLGGSCVTGIQRCTGAIIKPGCRGKQCYCCIPSEPVPTCPMNGNTGESCTGHRSCAEHYEAGSTASGIHTICPISTCNPVLTYCDMYNDGGKWTVFVSRDETHPDQEDFNRMWKDYKSGFGSCDREYWLGNEILHNLTSSEPHVMRLDAEDTNGNKKWLQYNTFVVDNEENGYRLTISGYNTQSTLGDILTATGHPNFDLNGIKFSTTERQNDLWGGGNCAKYYNGGGGFWYNACSAVTPTNNNEPKCSLWTPGDLTAIPLKKIRMAIRPAVVT